MATDRLAGQIAFLVEADKLKTVLRRTPLVDLSRLENSAEHSWHLALTALALLEYAPAGVDLQRVLELIAVHDLVEIDAGDTFAYDTAGHDTKIERERTAAERIFGLLPPDQSAAFRQRWEEFEAAETPESRYANALDRLQPLLLNMHSGGGSWKSHHVTRAAVLRRMTPIKTALPEVWPFVLDVIERFCANGTIVVDVEASPHE
jgi:5'-deoxynucleotidase YfbR-like HD superfamily hydrolase